jgi:hypothetical protein
MELHLKMQQLFEYQDILLLEDIYGGQSSEADLLNKSSCLAAALGVTKFIPIVAMN